MCFSTLITMKFYDLELSSDEKNWIFRETRFPHIAPTWSSAIELRLNEGFAQVSTLTKYPYPETNEADITRTETRESLQSASEPRCLAFGQFFDSNQLIGFWLLVKEFPKQT